MQVLVVDRDETARFVLQEILEFLGHQCHSFADLSLCLEQLSKTPDAIEAVIIDIPRPGKTGYDIAQTLRSYSNAPVIALTSDLRFVLQHQVTPMGLTDVIPKPITIDRLDATLERHCS